MRYVPEGPAQIARVVAVITLIGSVIAVQWPIDLSLYGPLGLGTFVGAFVAWAGIEIADYQTNRDRLKSDDVGKLNDLLKYIDRNQYYALVNHPIGNNVSTRITDGIGELVAYREQDIFEFHNRHIQRRYEEFAKRCDKFLLEFYSLYTSDGRGFATWRSPGQYYVPQADYDRIQTEVWRLARQFRALGDEWEEFIRVARRELKGASKTIDRYVI